MIPKWQSAVEMQIMGRWMKMAGQQRLFATKSSFNKNPG